MEMMEYQQSFVIIILYCMIGGYGAEPESTTKDIPVQNVTLTFNSANSVRIQWRMVTEKDMHMPIISIQTIEADAPCGHAPTTVIQNSPGSGRYYVYIVWGVHSDVPAKVCIQVQHLKTVYDWWSDTIPPAAKSPPLLTKELDLPDITHNTNRYVGSASAIGIPEPSWSWIINGKVFNETQRLSRQYGNSWITESQDLVIAGWDTIADKQLDVYYQAQNVHGAVKSRTVTIIKPFVSPRDGHPWDLNYIESVNYTSGVVLKCTSCEDSFPPLRNTWHYCTAPCAALSRVQVCPVITDFSGRKFLVEGGKKLVFTHMTQQDSGCYSCQSRNSILMENYISTVTLKTQNRSLEYSPKLIHQYPNTPIITVILATTLKLECAFQANPVAAILWFHNDTEIGTDIRRDIEEYSNTLTIRDVIHSDEGVYRCVGASLTSTRQDQAKFNVHVDAKPVILTLDSQSGYIGEAIILFCDTAYNSHISWYKNIDSKIMGTSRKYAVSIDKRRLAIYNLELSDTATYTCKATNRRGTDTKHATVIVLEPVRVNNISAQFSHEQNTTQIMFFCDASADPNDALNIEWTLDPDLCPEDHIITDIDTSTMQLIMPTSGNESISPCVAYCNAKVQNMTSCLKVRISQSEGSVEVRDCTESFDVQTTTDQDYYYNNASTGDNVTQPAVLPSRVGESKDSGMVNYWIKDNQYMVIGVSLLTVVVLVGSLFAIIRYQKRRKSSRDGPRLADYGSGGPLLGPVQYLREDRLRMGFVNNSLYTTSLVGENLKNQLREVEIPRKNLTLGEMIGRGQFGRVYKGTLEDKTYMNTDGKSTVAIKTLKYKADENDMVELFLREALMMRGFDHPHVLSLIGITMDSDRSPLVVLPYMENGDLRTYISSPDMDFRVLELLKMGTQVANGMAYLAAKRFVHRDLAARNCMVNKQGVVQVADFGLSRDLYSQEYYRTEDGKNPLPIRWMALESLEKKVFTTKSDVWSFGVLLWELVTRGATPYPGIDNWTLAQHIHQGGRMKQPLYCPSSVYDIMMECWSKSPKIRPTFEVLQAKLEAITSTAVTSDGEKSRSGARLERLNTLDMDIRTTKVTKVRAAKDQDLTALDES